MEHTAFAFKTCWGARASLETPCRQKRGQCLCFAGKWEHPNKFEHHVCTRANRIPCLCSDLRPRPPKLCRARERDLGGASKLGDVSIEGWLGRGPKSRARATPESPAPTSALRALTLDKYWCAAGADIRAEEPSSRLPSRSPWNRFCGGCPTPSPERPHFGAKPRRPSPRTLGRSRSPRSTSCSASKR